MIGITDTGGEKRSFLSGIWNTIRNRFGMACGYLQPLYFHTLSAADAQTCLNCQPFLQLMKLFFL